MEGSEPVPAPETPHDEDPVPTAPAVSTEQAPAAREPIAETPVAAGQPRSETGRAEPAGGEPTRDPSAAEPVPATAWNATPPATVAEPGRTGATGTEAWAKLLAGPELLALAAVQSIGPRAQAWLARTEHAYPTAGRAALARLATSQFTRPGRVGGVLGAVAGSYAPGVLLGTAAVAHAELVLHLAAAYGLDPSDPERAVDLLVFTQVHPDRASAEAALAAVRRSPVDRRRGAGGTVRRLGRMIVTRAGGWGVVRLINRYVPGVSLLAAFLTSRAGADAVAARANAHYRRRTGEENYR